MGKASFCHKHAAVPGSRFVRPDVTVLVQAPDGSRLKGLLKVYAPIGGVPPSLRPLGSVYERAHERLRGRYQDQ